ncbi:MAG: 3-phosphoshikimate 1-carboxyvinyltransferase, partial [Planctomycetales bacterium]|nr:3-phosphoshikimate 1-carboxyvinyltransferase [Planctomycetales bacterium]
MSSSQTIAPAGVVSGQIRPPGSKSITNRAFVCAALADGLTELVGVLDSDDTRVMIESLRRLGLRVDGDTATGNWQVGGGGGQLPAAAADLFIGNSGTSVRFLTAMVAVAHGTYHLDGVPRMRERPIEDLVKALNQLGSDVRCEAGTKCPPVTVNARGLQGGTTEIN